MKKNVYRKYFSLGIASALLVLSIGIAGIQSSSLLSNFLPTENEPVCSLQSEIDEVMVKKGELMGELGQANLQKETLLEKIASNSASLESARVLVEAARKEVLSESEMALREKKVADLLAQKGKRETLEGLEKDMISKESIALADKKKADEFLVAVGPKKSAYDAAVVQYEAKKALGVELAALKALPRPSSAQRNARKTLESQALAASPAKRPTDAQVSDRKKLEDLLVARDAAKKNIPTSTRAPGYQTALAAYNTLKNKYNADLATYRSTYASSAFGVNMTYAQLMVKVNQHATAVATYTTTLGVYNSTYPTNSGLTLAQIDGQIAAYNTANTAYNQKLTAYNTTYAATKNKTEAQLLAGVNTLKALYDTAEATYRTALNTYEAGSKVAAEKARSLYEQAQKDYTLAHPGDTRTALVLGQVYIDEKTKHEALVVENDRKKGVLAGLVLDQDKYAAIGERLSGEMKEVEGLLVSIGEKLTPVEEKISWMEGRKCSTTEQGLCDDKVDNNRDGTMDCADSYCLEFDPVCRPAQCGDHNIHAPEVCDDGNISDGDFCSSDCLRITDTATIIASYCGDGVIQYENGEQCDDGVGRNGGEWTCSATCTYNTGYWSMYQGDVCGDGRISGNEACDDGNTFNGDGCDSCQFSLMAGTESCGNGMCEGSETSGTCPGDCPYDNIVDNNTMRSGDATCGDGARDGSEIDPGRCDDGNLVNNDGCDDKCFEECLLPNLAQNSTGNGGLAASFLGSFFTSPTTNSEKEGKNGGWFSWLFSPFLKSATLLNGNEVMYTACKLGCTKPRAVNYDPKATTDDGSCIIYGCMDPNASNYDSEATNDDGRCQYYKDKCTDPNSPDYNPEANIYNEECYSYTCPDPDALNYEENDGSDPNRIADEKVCQYCEPEKITKYNDMIKNGSGGKVKKEIGAMGEKERECLKKEICKFTSIEKSECTIATSTYKPHFAYLQMYLELSGVSPGTLDGVYRSSKEITESPYNDSNTRNALVEYAGNTAKLEEIKNECSFMRELLKEELIKDYKTENLKRIKVTQMALYMNGEYEGPINGDRSNTFDALKEHYKWFNVKFGPVYFAGNSWEVGRATQFGYQDGGDNGKGTWFMDPQREGIATNNTSIQGASLPLPITVRALCPNIDKDIKNYVAGSNDSAYKITMCKNMLNSSDIFNPDSAGEYSGLAVLSLCIWYANEAGYTTCRDDHLSAKVRVKTMDKEITVPLVDIGPSESVWNGQKEATIDLTYGAMRALSGGSQMLYETCFDILGS